MKNKNTSYIICSESTLPNIIPDALHIEKTPDSCETEFAYIAAAALNDGFSLIHGESEIEDWRYIDTPKNRAIIKNALRKYPKFNKENWKALDQQQINENMINAYDLMLSDDEISIDAAVECWFDTASFFGVNIQEIEKSSHDDVWINLYATYTPSADRLTVFFVIDDNRDNITLYYNPSEDEKKVFIKAIEDACQKEFHQSLAEYITPCIDVSVEHCQYKISKDSLSIAMPNETINFSEQALPYLRRALKNQYAQEIISDYLSSSRPELMLRGIDPEILETLSHRYLAGFFNNECIIECNQQIIDEVCEDIDRM